MPDRKSDESVNVAWRNRLLEGGDPALAELMAEYPAADRGRLRQLARQASRTPADARAKRAATKLLRKIRALGDAAVAKTAVARGSKDSHETDRA
jgi:ribosomal 50S subunit-associated protein YjgA (DUF615 family)